MSIRTKPSYDLDFPPARLFLEDIEEIVGGLSSIFKRLSVNEEEDPVTRVICTIGNHQCDDVADLPKIARLGHDLELGVSRGKSAVYLKLYAWSFDSSMQSFGLERHREREVYERILAIFKKRRLVWRGIVHSLPWWWLAAILAIVVLSETLLMGLPKSRWTAMAALLLLAALLMGIYAVQRHTSVVFRHSWERSPVTIYLKDKILPIAFGAALGVGGTLLEMYIKRRFWP